jgi:hypothetical protein
MMESLSPGLRSPTAPLNVPLNGDQTMIAIITKKKPYSLPVPLGLTVR